MKIFLKSLLILFILGIGVAAFANIPKPQYEGFVKVQDGSLYYKEMGQGLPIVVLHGGPGLDQGYLQPQLLQLAANHRLIFYDQRGSGKSLEAEVDEKHITLEQFAQDLEEFRKGLGLEKFILLGHSWGGLLAMQYAIDHEDHLLGLILVNSSPADSKGMQAFLEQFGLRTKNLQNDINGLFSYEDFKMLNAAQLSDLYRTLFTAYVYNPNIVKELSLNFTEGSARSGYKVNEMMAKNSWFSPNLNLFPHLKTLTIPTLIFHGKQDIVPPWIAQEIKDAIPNAQLVILDQCSHFAYIEQPTQFFTELAQFLNKIPAL